MSVQVLFNLFPFDMGKKISIINNPLSVFIFSVACTFTEGTSVDVY